MFARAAMLLVCMNSAAALAEDSNELDCVIEPHMVVELSSRVDAIVETMEVERGQLVEKGQVLVRLEAGVERAAVAKALARAEATAEILAGDASAEFAQRRNARIQELHSSQAVSTDQLDEIKTEYELSRLQLERARENKLIAELELRQAREILNRHILRSPISGIVVARYLSPGESVEEQPIMKLAQVDPLRVEVIVPVMAFGSIKVGQKAIVRPEPPMEGAFPAAVSVVDGVADAASGTFRVRLSLPNEDYGLTSGLKCRVQFQPIQESPAMQMAATAPAPKIEAEATASVPSVAAVSAPIDSGPKRCHTIGPIKDAPEAEQVMKSIAKQAMQIELREEADGLAESYLVLAPRQASTSDTIALTERLIAEGIRDFQVIWRGGLKGRVSLGSYPEEAAALERQAGLTDLGFESELLPRGTPERRLWLDVELLPRITALDLAAAREILGKTELTASPCSTVVKE